MSEAAPLPLDVGVALSAGSSAAMVSLNVPLATLRGMLLSPSSL